MKESNTLQDNEIINLIRSTKAGDQDRAFAQLYDKCSETVYSMVRSNSGNATEAEDVFQDTLIVLHNNLRKDTFKLTCKLNTYIYSVARNLWLNQLRKSSRQTKLDPSSEEYVEVSDNSLQVLMRSEEDGILNELILKLDENCRTILKYFYFEKMKMKSIAVKLGYANEGVAKSKKSKCLKKLRDMVALKPHLKTTLWTS